MKGKNVWCLLMVGMMLTGCKTGTQSGAELKDIKIGITVYNQYDTFVSEMMDEVMAYTEEMKKNMIFLLH